MKTRQYWKSIYNREGVARVQPRWIQRIQRVDRVSEENLFINIRLDYEEIV